MTLINKIIKKKNNLYNNIIKTGSVLYIKYLLLKEDEIKIFLKFSDIMQPFVMANMYESRSKVTIILVWLYDPIGKLYLLFFNNMS